MVDSGILFLQDMKDMLKKFGIKTTPVGVQKGNVRKDGIVTKELRFRVLIEDNNKFINQIGWYK